MTIPDGFAVEESRLPTVGLYHADLVEWVATDHRDPDNIESIVLPTYAEALTAAQTKAQQAMPELATPTNQAATIGVTLQAKVLAEIRDRADEILDPQQRDDANWLLAELEARMLRKVEPYYQDDNATIYHGDCFSVLPHLSGITALICDPPYSSGGAFRGDRTQATTTKYVSTNRQTYQPEFAGDNRDQRSFTLWATLWLNAVYGACEPGAVLASFIDWRQLPSLTDAVQAAGWTWRGVAPWSKGFGRPGPSRFSNACEYVVWGSKGPMVQWESYPPGIFEQSTPKDKDHIAQKPIEVMRWVMQIVPPNGLVVDPFMGSGTTLRAALDCGHKAIGVESDERYCEIAAERLAQGTLDFG